MDHQVAHPVGAWRDAQNKHHKSRSYFTFDLSTVRGTEILSGWTTFAEETANDCSKPRNWEIWRTTGITGTTSWANPPQELEKLGNIGGQGCPADGIVTNLRNAVAAALARGEGALTLGLRVPQDAEGNLHLGRTIDWRPHMNVVGNTEPSVPSNLTLDTKPCGSTEPMVVRSQDPFLSARITDPDAEGSGTSQIVTATFAVWAVDNTQERLEWTTSPNVAPRVVSEQIPSGFVQMDRLYAWSVRANDDRVSSAWAPECRFIADWAPPATSPTVFSTDYPETGINGGPGIPGLFTFSANGSADVVGYRYYLIGGPAHYVAADAPGGSATVSLAPMSIGSQTLTVEGLDHAGNASEPTQYRFSVANTMPGVVDADRNAWAGDPHRLTFIPGMPDVINYAYRLDDGPLQTVAAGPDGTALVTVTPPVHGSALYLRSVSAAGVVSGERYYYIAVDSLPVVTSEEFLDGEAVTGVTGTFTFAPHMRNVVEYVFEFSDDIIGSHGVQTVSAGPDGIVTISFTPEVDALFMLVVTSRTVDGTESQRQEILFYSMTA